MSVTNQQLALVVGVPSALIVLSWLDSHRQHRRLSRKLQAMSTDLRGYSLERIEQQRQDVIDKGTSAGKTISTEAVLKRLLESKTTYEGPNREEYVAEVDRVADDFRKEHGPEIPADQAYAMLKELEARFGRVE